jgi:transposase
VLRREVPAAGLDASVLSEFRPRLVEGAAEDLLLDPLLAWCCERRLLKARGRQRTDSTHLLAAVRALNRIEVVGETLRHARNRLAIVAPAWRCTVSPSEGGERSARRAADDRLPPGKAAREALALTIGADGYTLRTAISAPTAPGWLRAIPAVETLRQGWVQNYMWQHAQLQWRASEDLPPATRFISSPYDRDAHYARKHTTPWVGYKAPIPETCEADRPHLITHVETTTAPTADGAVTPRMQAALQAREVLPNQHSVDSGFLAAAWLLDSQVEDGVDLLGPTRPDCHGQARAGEGCDAQPFQIDWAQQAATCPEGRTSLSWSSAVDSRHNPLIKIKFSTKDCRGWASRDRCMRSRKRYPRRTLTVRPREHQEALQAARQRERTPGFAAEYARRAGIEGTISRGVRRSRLRRTRYLGQARVQLGHILPAVGLNFVRLGAWFVGVPRAETRTSPFARLLANASTV